MICLFTSFVHFPLPKWRSTLYIINIKHALKFSFGLSIQPKSALVYGRLNRQTPPLMSFPALLDLWRSKIMQVIIIFNRHDTITCTQCYYLNTGFKSLSKHYGCHLGLKISFSQRWTRWCTREQSGTAFSGIQTNAQSEMEEQLPHVKKLLEQNRS